MNVRPYSTEKLKLMCDKIMLVSQEELKKIILCLENMSSEELITRFQNVGKQELVKQQRG